MNRLVAVSIAAMALGVSGCASVRSTPDSGAKQGDGLVYYLPEQRVVVTLTVNQGKHSLAITESTAFPDLSARFVANFRRNQLGKNKISLTTTTGGLLHGDSTSATTPQVTDVFKALAATGAAIGVRKGVEKEVDKEIKPDPCALDGTYLRTFDPRTKPEVLCGYTIKTKALGPASSYESSEMPSVAEYGLYYRRPLPYLITVTRTGSEDPVAERIVLVPTKNSPVALLRASRALFATTTGKFVFSNGMPTQYEQELDSELLGLVKLPADVLTAYFTAIGSAFDGRKASITAESNYLAVQNAAAIQAEKTRACIAAVAGGDAAEITAACKP